MKIGEKIEIAHLVTMLLSVIGSMVEHCKLLDDPEFEINTFFLF